MDGEDRQKNRGIAVVPPSEDVTEFDIVGRGIAQWRRERPDIDCSGKSVVGRILRLQDVILRAANIRDRRAAQCTVNARDKAIAPARRAIHLCARKRRAHDATRRQRAH